MGDIKKLQTANCKLQTEAEAQILNDDIAGLVCGGRLAGVAIVAALVGPLGNGASAGGDRSGIRCIEPEAGIQDEGCPGAGGQEDVLVRSGIGRGQLIPDRIEGYV